MQVIGFNLNKISAEKPDNFSKSNVNTNIEFTDLGKEDTKILSDGTKATKLSFEYSVNYEDAEEAKKKKEGDTTGAVFLSGSIILATSKEETKDIEKAWKKKKLPQQLQIALYNLILKKCSPQALYFEDQLGLPLHVPIPQITPRNTDIDKI